MSMPESFQALRRANPRAKAGFGQSVEAAADAVHNEIAARTTALHPAPGRVAGWWAYPQPERRLRPRLRSSRS